MAQNRPGRKVTYFDQMQLYRKCLPEGSTRLTLFNLIFDDAMVALQFAAFQVQQGNSPHTFPLPND